VQATEWVKAQLLVLLHGLGVDDPAWHTLSQGDAACVFHYVPGRRRGRSNSWLQIQWMQQQQQQQQGRVHNGSSDSCEVRGGAGGSVGGGDRGGRALTLSSLSDSKGSRDGLAGNYGVRARAGSGVPVQEDSTFWEHSAIRDGNSGIAGRGGSVGDVGAEPEEAGISDVVFEGRRLFRAKKLAITILAPWHLSVNAGVWMCGSWM